MLIEDNRAQISAELLIIMAAVIALAFILVRSLTSTSQKAAAQLDNATNKLLQDIAEIAGD